MGFQFGEMQVREQAPWAYDTASDLPKSHPWYPVAAGLTGVVQVTKNPFAGNAFYDTSPNEFLTPPAGKTAYLLDVLVYGQKGQVQLQVMNNGTSTGIVIASPSGGGQYHFKPNVPLKFAAGQKMSFQLYNVSATVDAGETHGYLSYVLL